jgi:hypothetical protein
VSPSIADALDPSGILCTTIIDFIHSGVRIARTAANAARSARSWRARRVSSKPNATAAKTVNAVATFARVERSTRRSLSELFCAERRRNSLRAKKTAGFPPESCGFELANYFRLIFVHNYMIDHARFARACVVNMHTLTPLER